MRRYLAFDIETAKILPDQVNDIMAHRPLGIACAAAVASDLDKPLVWHGTLTQAMTPAEVSAMIADLAARVAEGYTLTTWNGLGFDFNIIAEESGAARECAAIAAPHVDMLFHVLCARGHRVSLQSAADGMRLPGKMAGVSGAEAPAMWAAGRTQEVIDYCIQDVRVTLQLAEACDMAKRFTWITKRGTPQSMALPQGWLTAEQAYTLPQPDVSWMSAPPSRDEAMGWVKQAQSR